MIQPFERLFEGFDARNRMNVEICLGLVLGFFRFGEGGFRHRKRRRLSSAMNKEDEVGMERERER